MKYFTLEELCRSQTADKLGIDNLSQCSKENIYNLMQLVDKVLDPLREAFGKPIIVNSGFRCYQLNKAVKGAANSHHLYGMAADLTSGTKEGNKELFNLVQSLNLPFTQLISYNYSFIHVSYDIDNLKKQILHL